jgi:hypothetical protein
MPQNSSLFTFLMDPAHNTHGMTGSRHLGPEFRQLEINGTIGVKPDLGHFDLGDRLKFDFLHDGATNLELSCAAPRKYLANFSGKKMQILKRTRSVIREEKTAISPSRAACSRSCICPRNMNLSMT